ncbi:MAG TPA: hypothetical protein ENF57_00520 [Candidatus Korarchaeota archaeon]|nr:hypothetical protein [Candidatus Korarchaeota archaeon]
MSSNVIVKGELVFKDEESAISFFERLGASSEGLRSGRMDLGDVRVEEIREADGRYHVRFEGDVSWPSKLAPQGENPLDWLKTKVMGLGWDVDDLKTLEIYRESDDLMFVFYSEEELAKKREEYNRWWMDSASNILGLF